LKLIFPEVITAPTTKGIIDRSAAPSEFDQILQGP